MNHFSQQSRRQTRPSDRHNESHVVNSNDEVIIEGSVLLKIIKHCSAHYPVPVSGRIYGFVSTNPNTSKSTLEVNQCFSTEIGGSNDGEETPFNIVDTIIKNRLSEVRSESRPIGWYTSVPMSGITYDSIVHQILNQRYSPTSIAVTYDHFRTLQGQLGLTVYRASALVIDTFNRLFATVKASSDDDRVAAVFAHEDFASIPPSQLLEVVPYKFRNGHLTSVLLADLVDSPPKDAPRGTIVCVQPTESSLASGNVEVDNTSFGISGNAEVFLSKNLTEMNAGLDEFTRTMRKNIDGLEKVAKDKKDREDYIERRRRENEELIAQGKPPLPEDDYVSRFSSKERPKDSFENSFLSIQLGTYANNMSSFVHSNFGKLFLSHELEATQSK